MLFNIVAIFLGGGIGAVLRYFTSMIYLKFFNFTFPLATLSVNILGSLLMGLLAAYLYGNTEIPDHIKYSLTVGLCGGLTTFSTFSFEVVEMLKRGEFLIAILYIFLSLFLCLCVTAAGFYWAKNYVYY